MSSIDRQSSSSASDYEIGDRLLVRRDIGLPLAKAQVTAKNAQRPHLIKVIYLQPRTGGAWIARTGIVKDGACERAEDR